MKKYEHLNMSERERIGNLLRQGSSVSDIASNLGRCRTTIYRELRRNRGSAADYWPDRASQLSHIRRNRGSRIDRCPSLKEFILDKLCCHYWTPEQIAGFLKCRQNVLPSVCHETIYSWLYEKAQKDEKLWKFLPRHKAKRGLRKRRGKGSNRIPNRISIDERPKRFGNKRFFGNWEGDLMSFRKNSQHMVVLRENKSMFTLSRPLESKKAVPTAKTVIDLLKVWPPKALNSMTLDNGGEFTQHGLWQEELGIPNYFCDPYASWQKGGVENTNGRLRRDLPRKTDLHKMSQEDFDEVIENYNHTPRKSLKWKTPHEVFFKNLNFVALRT